MIDRSIYIAHPIHKNRYDLIMKWREPLVSRLRDSGIYVFVPHMNRHEIIDTPPVGSPYLVDTNDIRAGDRVLVEKDFSFVSQSKILFANLSEADVVSIGSVGEISWAYALRRMGYPIFTIVLMDNHGLHDHPFIREQSSAIVGDLEEGEMLVYDLFQI